MWTYINKESLAIFTIPISNIDYAKLSKGIESDKTWIGKYYHPTVNKYSNSEYLTVLYKKHKGAIDKPFICFEGLEALQQLSLISEDVLISK